MQTPSADKFTGDDAEVAAMTKAMNAANKKALPKRKYLRKVASRLATVNAMLSDRARVEEMMRRVGGFGIGSDFHNKMEALYMFLNADVPALLTAIEEMTVDTASHKGLDSVS